MFFKHFASKNQLPGLPVSGTLVKNGLIVMTIIDSRFVIPVICDTFHDLVPSVQFQKHEKYSWRSAMFSKFVNLNLQLYQK